MTLTRLPGSKVWVETDDNGEVIGTYNKANITADIQSINLTLERYPSPAQSDSDVADLLISIEGKWTIAKNARIVELINKMYQTYQSDPQMLEAAQLISKRDALVELRARLV